MSLTRVFFCLHVLTLNLFAESLSLGIPESQGDGCPSGSVSASLSPDASELSVLFDSFTVEARGELKNERKNCRIRVPVHVPKGAKVAIVKMDFRGFVSLPKNAFSVLNVDHFFFKGGGPRTQFRFDGVKEEDFLVRDVLIKEQDRIWTKCGDDTDLKILAALRVNTNKKGDLAMAALDSLDISSGLRYKIKIKSCTGREVR